MATEQYQKIVFDELVANFIQSELVFLVRWFIEHKGISVDPIQWNEYAQWEEVAIEAVRELYINEIKLDQDNVFTIAVHFATEKRPAKHLEEEYLEKLRRAYSVLQLLSSTGIETAKLYYGLYSAWKNQTIRKQHPYGSLKEMIARIMKSSEQRQQMITEEVPEYFFDLYLEDRLPKGFAICKYGSDDEKLESLPYKLLIALTNKNDCSVTALPQYFAETASSSILMLLPKMMKRDELHDHDKRRQETFSKIIGSRNQFDQIEYQLYSLVSKLFPGERLIGFVPEDFLYASATKPLRDWLQDISVIRGIISIPSHALRPHSQTKVSMIILDKRCIPDNKESDVYVAKANKLSELEGIITGFYDWERD